jgi:hypothetical protein
MKGAVLSDARLVEADLTQANLARSSLLGANLAGANLAGADLTGALLVRTDLRGARWDRRTRWPEGEAAWITARSDPLQAGDYQVRDGRTVVHVGS